MPIHFYPIPLLLLLPLPLPFHSERVSLLVSFLCGFIFRLCCVLCAVCWRWLFWWFYCLLFRSSSLPFADALCCAVLFSCRSTVKGFNRLILFFSLAALVNASRLASPHHVSHRIAPDRQRATSNDVREGGGGGKESLLFRLLPLMRQCYTKAALDLMQCSAVRDGSEQPSAASLLRRDGMGFFTQPLLSNSTSSSSCSCSCSCKVVSSGPPGRRKLIQNLGRRRRRRRRKKADESEQGVGGM